MAKIADSESLEAQFLAKCSIKTIERDKKPLEFIPLMLRDVLRCSPTSRTTIYEAFNGTIQFRTMIVHARVVGKIAPSKKCGYYRFEIDDCTAVVPLIIWLRDDIDEIQRLKNEISSRRFVNQHTDILDALDRILDKTRNQLDPSHITIGSKLFVFGRPHFFRDQLSIYSFIWDIDERSDRFMELSFKDELVEWYLKRYPILVE